MSVAGDSRGPGTLRPVDPDPDRPPREPPEGPDPYPDPRPLRRIQAATAILLAPSTFMVLFDGRNIRAEGNNNQALVGLTGAQATTVGAKIPPSGPPPTVDADIDACSVLSGQERTDCWTALDKKITEQVVPSVPLVDATAIRLLGPAVTKFDFDQFGAEMALAHVAVDPSLQK